MPIIGMQVHFLQELEDEGVDQVLDFLQCEGLINTLFIATQHDYLASSGFDRLYHNRKGKTEHEVNGYFFEFDESYYSGTFAKPVPCPYTGSSQDLFRLIIEKCRKRGIATYAMILNRWPNSDLYPEYHMRAVNGGIVPKVFCAHNPGVRNLYKGLIRDLLDHYELDGLFLGLLDHYVQFGFEHLTDELAYALGVNKFKTPEVGLSCFCEHCLEKAIKQGIDVEKIRSGLLKGVACGWIPHKVESMLSADDAFRFLTEVPEYLEWMRFRTKEFTGLHEELYGFSKQIKPEIQIALNTYGPSDSWKYCADYGELKKYSDWMKPMFYSGTYPGKPHSLANIRMQTRKAVEMGEVKPVVAGINGIGSVATPENVIQGLEATTEGGATGAILAWDYAMIPLDNIRAFGSWWKLNLG